MRHDRIAKEWLNFEQQVLSGAPEIQVRETRRAFYAGAVALLHVLVRINPSDEPTELDLQAMDEINQELIDFKNAVLRGAL